MRRPLLASTGDASYRNARRATEDSPESRTESQRDRDRVLYSSALQRLGGITQVSSPESGYAFHTRLTHSLKVAQVAQRTAQRLLKRGASGSGPVGEALEALDADAAEAAGLAHDLGHPPFGHVGEQELKRLAVRAELDGFEGNAQSFRVLTRLGAAGPMTGETTGLNLTRRVLNGTLKYPWLRNSEDAEREQKWGAYPPDSEALNWVREGRGETVERSLEAEIMDWADDVTYAVHDVDDFFRAGLIPLDRLRSDRAELERFQAYLREKHGSESPLMQTAEMLEGDKFGLGIEDPYEGRLEQRATLRAAGGGLIGRYVSDVSVEEDGEMAVFSIPDQLIAEVSMLKELTWCYVIDRPSLAIVQEGQREVIRGVFERLHKAALDGEHRLFPPGYVERVKNAGTEAAKTRGVIDFIAGLTENAVVQIYHRLRGISTGPLLEGPGQLM